MLSLNEFGGSVTILIEFYNIDNGNFSVGSVVKKSLKSLLNFLFISAFSNSAFSYSSPKAVDS